MREDFALGCLKEVSDARHRRTMILAMLRHKRAV
jgi:hypothetical protein